MIYLFIGQESPSKDAQLKAVRKEFLAKSTEQFNLDILHAEDLNLKSLQERLLCLPVKSAKRILLVRNASALKEDIREFILKYAKRPYKQVILILDVIRQERKDEFLANLCRVARVWRSQETMPLSTFSLSDQISLRRTDRALKILRQLLDQGQRPERILGGLRYACERESALPEKTKRKFKLLLNCDIDIKTGRLEPVFALERLVVDLCSPGNPFH